MGCKTNLAQLDTDGDGVISFDEFATIASLLEKRTHVIFKQPSFSKCKDLLTNDAEMVTKAKDTCRKFMSTMRVDDTTLFKEFQKLDDGDARLETRELKTLIKKHVPSATMAEQALMVFTILNVADVNRDDSISFDEFKAVMQA